MKYYINTNKEIFGIEQGQENLVQADWVEISLEEIAELQKPTEEQIIAQKLAEAQAYLTSTDWYFARLADTGEEVPEEVKVKRAEARTFIEENK